MYINKKNLDKIYQHALETYPDECCGIVTGNDKYQTIHRCENIQNQLHEEDPVRYPRDARTAYVIDRSEAEKIFIEAKRRGEDVLAFYHSHTDHDAYFSVEDVAAQTVFGEPEFPETIHIVISVRTRKIHDVKYFKGEGDKKDFIAI